MRWLCLAVVGATAAYAQVPVIETVENAASNMALTAMSPQSLITIRGQHLASSISTPNGYPLPLTLGGATVTFFYNQTGPVQGPLLYASPTQINAEVPYPISSPNIIVTTAAGASQPYQVPVAIGTGTFPFISGPLGIFSQDSSGCGQAVAYNVHPDGSVTLNTPQTSLDPEKDVGLTIFLTGLGGLEFLDRQLAVPWVYNSADNLVSTIPSAVTFGAPGVTGTVQEFASTYLGPAPNQVGVDQVNALGQWKGGPQGCKVPVSLALFAAQVVDNLGFPGSPSAAAFAAYTASQVVDVSIQPGGGQCIDPPDGTLGVVTWQKNTVSDVSGVAASEGVTAQFIQAEGLGFPQPPTGAPFPAPALASSEGNQTNYGPAAVTAAACNASLPNTLDAGALRVSGPGLAAMALQPAVQDGRLTYSAALDPETLAGGDYRLKGTGSSQVGGFTASANIPAPIGSIATTTADFEPSNLQPGTQLEPPCQITSVHPIQACRDTYTITWTGGDNRSIVTAQFIVGGIFEAAASAYGGAGSVSIPVSYGAYPALCGADALLNYDFQNCTLMPEGAVEVIITQTPYHAPSQPFAAPGLGWGGESTWQYVWDFRGLTN